MMKQEIDKDFTSNNTGRASAENISMPKLNNNDDPLLIIDSGKKVKGRRVTANHYKNCMGCQ